VGAGLGSGTAAGVAADPATEEVAFRGGDGGGGNGGDADGSVMDDVKHVPRTSLDQVSPPSARALADCMLVPVLLG